MSLRFKTIVGVALIEAVLLVILITTVLNYMRLSSEEALENYVETTTRLFVTTTKDALLSYDLASLEAFVEEILNNKGILYTRIYDSENNLLASGGKQEQLKRPFIKDNSYKSVKDDIYDTRTSILIDDNEYGHIEMGISTEQIEIAVGETRK